MNVLYSNPMKVSALILLIALSASAQPKPGWHAAVFRGLTVGKSRKADVTRILGTPVWSRSTQRSEDEKSETETWVSYENAGEFPGTTRIAVDDRDVIRRIEFYPARLTKQQAIAHFGTRYVVTKYDFERCGSSEDSEELFESSKGLLTYVEYRSRGIALSVGVNDMITKISYVAEPIGSVRSKCKKK